MKASNSTKRNLILSLIIIIFIICLYFIKNSNDNFSLLITVKTTAKSHEKRVSHIVNTWFQLDPKNIFFITDTFDSKLNQSINGNLVNTSCGSAHDAASLGCKLNEELSLMVKKNAMWSCHFDDDNYVNVPILKSILSKFDPTIPYYIGKTSSKMPFLVNGTIPVWFAHGGSGICLSNAALQILKPMIKNNQLTSDGIRYQLLDDLALGFLMSKLGIKLTEVAHFLSQFDQHALIPLQAIPQIPVFCYKEDTKNFINLPFFFDPKDDPFKFQTLHCFLYPAQCNPNLRRLNIEIYFDKSQSYNAYGTFVLPSNIL